jgi:anhydro-N-acetylmuramic acid kinase
MRRIVGLMSGTSADGITAAMVEVSGTDERTRMKLLAWKTYRYDDDFKARVFELFSPRTGSVNKICQMNFSLAERFAAAALKLIRESGLAPEDIDLIGSHGQTVYHIPFEPRSTLQIGQAAVIAERTGITTISDFRVRDVAAGGHGAPLVALPDYFLFRSSRKGRAIQNVGGIANATVIPRLAKSHDVYAFDTGPGNMIIDSVVRKLTKGRLSMDRYGTMASKGRVDHELLSWLMESPFVRMRPPKTTGREEFGEQFSRLYLRRARSRGLKMNHIVATVTAFTAESIAYNYRRFVYPRSCVDEVVLGGGGAKNRTLVKMLQERLQRPILFHEDFGIPSEAKEACAFAILANQTMEDRPGNLPSATGALKSVVLGAICPGRG